MKEIKKRTQIKRPILHHIIIAGYFLAPFVNIAAYLLSQKSRFPLKLLVVNFFYSFEVFGGILILSMPLIAIGLYFVHRFSFYAFILHGLLVVIDNVQKVLHSKFDPYQLILLGGSLLLLSVVFYILRRDFRAPYFQALPRSFREKTRIPINHFITINEKKYSISDISSGGCYVSQPPDSFQIGETVTVVFKAAELEFQTAAQIVRTDENGFGLMFVNLDKQVKKNINTYLNNRFTLRIKCDLQASIFIERKEFQGLLHDVSKTGGYFCSQDSSQYHTIIEMLKELDIGELGNVKLSVKIDEQPLPIWAQIIWLHDGTTFDKPAGIGLAFDRSSNREIKKLLKTLQKQELTR